MFLLVCKDGNLAVRIWGMLCKTIQFLYYSGVMGAKCANIGGLSDVKPFLEKITSENDASWTMLNRRLEDGIPFEWHHHPEYELTLTLNSRGQRFVGDQIDAYGDADLVLLGPNLPHTWVSSEKIDPVDPHIALVMWFKPDWAEEMTSLLKEFSAVKTLLALAGRGVHFSKTATERVRPRIENMFDKPPAERLITLMEVLNHLADDADAVTITNAVQAGVMRSDESARIDRVLEHIHQNYSETVSVAGLADIAALSTSGFHRFFRRHMRQNLTDYVARLRIGEACALLAATDRPIAHIAESVGYNALANFNRQFRALKHMTPRAYRTRFHQPHQIVRP